MSPTIVRFVSLVILLGFVFAACADESKNAKSLEEELRTRAASMGDNVLMISPPHGIVPVGRPISKSWTFIESANQMVQTCNALSNVSPVIVLAGSLKYGSIEYSLAVGASAEYLLIYDWKVSRGSMFSASDIRDSKRVCVLGSEAAKRMFGDEDPVGKSTSLVWHCGKDTAVETFQVVGVLKEKGRSLDGSSNRDAIAIIPWTTAKAVAADDSSHVVRVDIVSKVSTSKRVEEAKKQISSYLRDRHGLGKDVADDFIIEDENQRIETFIKSARASSIRHPAMIPPDAGIRDLIEQDAPPKNSGATAKH